MLPFDTDDFRNKYPGFYNIYAIESEISVHSLIRGVSTEKSGRFLDDFYGRIIDLSYPTPYGDSSILDYYVQDYKDTVVDTMRVPFRKIPIFRIDEITEMEQLIIKIKSENKPYEVLLRGQAKSYPIDRSVEEKKMLYGLQEYFEPSFQPSFLRANFDEFFIYNLWHCQTALMLNDVGIDLEATLSPSDLQAYNQDVEQIKVSADFTPIALGIAQHYGLPSIGLDLTDNIKVAIWFATHELKIGDGGRTEVNPISDFNNSTVYIFRCPGDAVFSHRKIKPKFIDNTRPDRQDAWFSHVGWGFAKNQLASYLVCGIRLGPKALELFEDGYNNYLFPSRKEDLILNYFLDASQNSKYTGEVKRALRRIYAL
jgi:hypothetical protein